MVPSCEGLGITYRQPAPTDLNPTQRAATGQPAPTEDHRGARRPGVGLGKGMECACQTSHSALLLCLAPGICVLYMSMFEVFAFAFASKVPLKFHLALATLREKALRQGEFIRGQMLLGGIVAPETKGANGAG